MVRNLFISLKVFISHFVKGLATASPMITGTIVPRLAAMMVWIFGKPSLKPRGMASFSSTKGVIAAKNTLVSSVM